MIRDSSLPPFPWKQLLEKAPGIAHKILSISSSRVLAYRSHERRSHEAQKLLPKMPIALDTEQILEIERSRDEIEGHCPQDTLTVTFSDVVRRGSLWLDSEVEEAIENNSSDDESSWDDLPLDANAICAKISAEMDLKQTWTDVSKIRLVPSTAYDRTTCYVELVRPGEDGEETVRVQHGFLLSDRPKYTSMLTLMSKLSEKLLLRCTKVDGVYEYTRAGGT